MLAGHLAFNFALLILTPVCVALCRLFEERFAVTSILTDAELPAGVAEGASRALPALKRKLSAMLDTTLEMLDEVTSEHPDKQAMVTLEQKMNVSMVSLREVYANLPGGSESDLKDMSQILNFAIRVERCGDVLSGKMEALRAVQAQSEFRFSNEGQAEIAGLVDAVREAILIAHDATWTGEVETAERLVRYKQFVADLEARSRSNHMKRLRSGNIVSPGSSDQHLETIASPKEINSKFATIGYAILERSGGLKKTWLRNSDSVSRS